MLTHIRWAVDLGSTLPLYHFYYIQILKGYCFASERMVHLPYMLKSWEDPKYQYHRDAALEASRQVIYSYQALRGGSEGALLCCDVMDFQAFSGAITLAIDLLSGSNQRDPYQVESDWNLIRQIAGTFKTVSTDLECNVASQSAHLVEHFLAVHDGIFFGADEYEALIPYFGKVRIKRPTQTNNYASDFNKLDFPNVSTIQFDTNYFWQSTPGDYLWDAELGIDWTSIVPDEGAYDWNQTFEYPV